MNDEIKFRCERCGKDFDPDPDMVMEAGIVTPEDYQKHYEEGQEWAGEAPTTEGAIFLCQKCFDELAEENK